MFLMHLVLCSATKVHDFERVSGAGKVESLKPSDAGDKTNKHDANNAIIMRLTVSFAMWCVLRNSCGPPDN